MSQQKLRESLIKLINETSAVYMCISESGLDIANKGFVIVWNDKKGHVLRVTYYNNEDSLKEVRFLCNDSTKLPCYRNVLFKTEESTNSLPFPLGMNNVKIADDDSENLQSMKAIENGLKSIILQSKNWEIS